MQALLLLALMTPAADAKPTELFAREAWYRSQAGKEETFVGVLGKLRAVPAIGFARVNPYTLTLEKAAKKSVREVYVGGNNNLLDAFVGKRVAITGKAVDMEVEGREHRELWPASIQLAKADTDTLKVMATSGWRAPVRGGKAQHLVLKDADSLAVALGLEKDEAGRKAALAAAAKLFKVDAVDFNKQMIVVVTAGPKPTGGYAVTIGRVTVEDKTAKVQWQLKSPGAGDIVTQAFTHPAQAALVERFEGEVKFDPPLKKE